MACKNSKFSAGAGIGSPNRRVNNVLRRLSDTQVNLDNFALSDRTLVFFTQVAGLLTCKKTADSLYQDCVQSGGKILNGPDFESFKNGDGPVQQGPDTMTVQEVREDAREKKPEFDALVRKVVEGQGLDPDQEVLIDGQPIVKDWGSYKVLTLADLKTLDRSIAKTENEYGGEAKFLCDVGRATVVCRTEEEIAKVLLALKAETEVVRIKNRFSHPTYTGIRDILMNIRVSGHVFEFQVHQADLLALDARSHGHGFYEHFREYFVGTRESYQTRIEIFDKLGEAVRVSVNQEGITAGIKAILAGEDKAKLLALVEITDPSIFADHELNLTAKKALQGLLGEGDEEERLNGLSDMANAFVGQGDYGEALEYYGRALKGYESALGKDHPDSLNTINGMGVVYQNQGDYCKALEYYGRALKGMESALGKDHPSTLNTVNNMGMVNMHQGDYRKALEYYGRALKGFESAQGKDHPDTLNTVNGMGVVYQNQGDYSKALEYYGRALKGFESALGKDNPSTLIVAYNIDNNRGRIYDEEGDYPKALEHYRRAIQGYESIPGWEAELKKLVKKMGKCLETAGRMDELRAHLDKYPNLRDNDSWNC